MTCHYCEWSFVTCNYSIYLVYTEAHYGQSNKNIDFLLAVAGVGIPALYISGFRVRACPYLRRVQAYRFVASTLSNV